MAAKLGLLVRDRFGHGIIAAREELNNTFDLLVLVSLFLILCLYIFLLLFAKRAILLRSSSVLSLSSDTTKSDLIRGNH